MQSLVLSFPIVTYFCSLQRCAVFLWSNAWALKKPWINPKNHPGNVHRQKLKLMEVGWGFTGSLDVEAYPKKIIAMAFLQKSSDIKKSTAANTPSRHHGDVHSHHTLCGLFFTAGYRYTGPYDVPLLRVLNQSHVSPTPWKAQKHQRRFKKLQGALPGQFFQLLKTRNSLKHPPFSSGVKKRELKPQFGHCGFNSLKEIATA